MDAKTRLPEAPELLDAAILFQQMLAAVCDEHTNVVRTTPLTDDHSGRDRVLNGGIVAIGEQLFLDPSLEELPDPIVSINGKTAEEIVTLLRSIVSADGCATRDVLFSNHADPVELNRLLISQYLAIEGRFANAIQRDAETDAAMEIRLGTTNWQLEHQLEFRRMLGDRAQLLSTIGIKTHRSAWYSAHFSPQRFMIAANSSKSVFYLYVAEFTDSDSQRKALDAALRELVKADPDHVIIDLTDNFGGYTKRAQRLLSYFLRSSSKLGQSVRARIRSPFSGSDFDWISKARKTDHAEFAREFRHVRKKNGQYRLSLLPRSFGNREYRGKITVLVSPRTASAATFAATTLKHKSDATVVGDIGDTSMKTACFSPPGNHILPYTKIHAGIPFVCHDRLRASRSKGNLLKPDVAVDTGKHDSRLINDAILEAAIKFLGISSLAGVEEEVLGELLYLQPIKRGISIKLETVPGANRVWMGVAVRSVSGLDDYFPRVGREPVAIVTGIFEDSPAEGVDIQPGDILYAILDNRMKDLDDVRYSMSYKKPGDSLYVETLRIANSTSDLVAGLEAIQKQDPNHVLSSYLLGVLFLDGDFPEQTKTRGVELIESASRAGSAIAARVIGELYFDGYSLLPKDGLLGLKYYRHAANLGDDKSMLRMADIYDDQSTNLYNPYLAALYLLHSYQARNPVSRNRLFVFAESLSHDTRIAIQKILRDKGRYEGKMDGSIDVESKQAIVQLRSSVQKIKLPELPFASFGAKKGE